MSFGEHLEELRGRVIRALLGLAVGTAICIGLGEHIMGFLVHPYKVAMSDQGFAPAMINLDPTETFMQYFKTCLIFGLGLSSPYVLYQLWQFIAAGLYPHERRWVAYFAPTSMGLFFLGVVFMVKAVLPGVLRFLIATAAWIPPVSPDISPGYATTQLSSQPATLPILKQPPAAPREGDAWISEHDGSLNWVVAGRVLRLRGHESGTELLVQPQYSLQMYLDFVNGMCLAFGLGFQIPIVVVMLVLARIVTATQLTGMRKIVIVLLVTAAALLTPSGDPASQLLLAVPMLLLFEIGLFVARRVERGRAASA